MTCGKSSAGDNLSRGEHNRKVVNRRNRKFTGERADNIRQEFCLIHEVRCDPPQSAATRSRLLEVARAAGVAEVHVRALVGPDVRHLIRADAVRIGRMLVERSAAAGQPPTARPLFGLFSNRMPAQRSAGVPLAVSSTLHGALLVVLVLLASLGVTPHAASIKVDAPVNSMRLVFLNIPGPGGGGGGGGLQEVAPPPKAMREGHHTLNSPIPERHVPAPLAPPQRPARAPSTRVRAITGSRCADRRRAG